MANCARVTSRDHYSTNGVVHIVDRVILPATQTIAEIVQNDVQLRSLRKALEKTNMLEKLSQPNGQFTLFAPTDDAFSKMDATLKVQSKGSRNITSTKPNLLSLQKANCSIQIFIYVSRKNLLVSEEEQDVQVIY